jgi:hypothetical protein
MRNLLLALAAFLLLPGLAHAADNYPVKDGSGSTVTLRSKDLGSSVSANIHIVNPQFHTLSSTLTRIANSTAYAGTTTSPVAVCLFTSVTACAPLTVAISADATAGAVSGELRNVRLIKSTTGATGATFRVLMFTASPTLTSVFDTTVYTPKLADITASPTKFVGSWECASQKVNGDNSTYDCIATTNSGTQSFLSADGNLYAVVTATGAYAPGSGETFYILADGTVTNP